MAYLDKRGGELASPTAARPRPDLNRSDPERRKSAIPKTLVALLRRSGVPLVLFLLCVLGDAACSPTAPPDGEETDHRNLPALAGPFRLPPKNPLVCPGANDASNLPSGDPPPQETAPAGTIPGSFEIGQAGQATYTMPLDLPPGRHGMQPSLSIHYDSLGGDGMLGMGFSLTGLSAVTRCPKTMARDGVIRDVRYQGDDAFCLDGQRLVVISDSSEQTEYRTFPDTFAKIIAHHPTSATTADYDPAKGPLFWTESTKAGLQIQFGASTVAEATSGDSGTAFAMGGAVRSWWITSVADRRGNTVEYSYQKDSAVTGQGTYTTEIVPASIRYTGRISAPKAATRNSVQFKYDTKDAADNRTLYSGGMAQKSARRLRSIQMLTSGGALVHEYDIDYDSGASSHRTILARNRGLHGRSAQGMQTADAFHLAKKYGQAR